MSAVTASLLAAFGHAAIISRTSSTWLACGSRPKPTRARKKPRFCWVISSSAEGPPPVRRSNILRSAARAGQVRLRQRRHQHHAAHALVGHLGVVRRERLQRDAAHRVADEHGVVQVHALEHRPYVLGEVVDRVPATRRIRSRRGRGGRTPMQRNRCSGKVSNCFTHTRVESVTPCEKRIGGALAAADRVDAAAVVARVADGLVERRDERLARVGVGPAPNAGHDGALDRVGGTGEARRRAGDDTRAQQRASRPTARMLVAGHHDVRPGHARADAAHDLVRDRSEAFGPLVGGDLGVALRGRAARPRRRPRPPRRRRRP